MPREIERKFLVVGDAWRQGEGMLCRQGYLSTVPERTVRVRRTGDTAYLTVKGKTVGATRLEYEYEISVKDAEEMLDRLCEQPLVEKTRHRVAGGGVTWEIDEFRGDNEGLILAEVELLSEDQSFEQPPWLGQEVTDDSRYFNASLVRRPFRQWPERERLRSTKA